jgi:hypothetical protein
MGLFIKSLDQGHLLWVPEEIRQWYECEAEGWFGLPQEQHKPKLERLARYNVR